MVKNKRVGVKFKSLLFIIKVMEYEAVVATIAAAAKVQQPCVMELNVVARALIDVLV